MGTVGSVEHPPTSSRDAGGATPAGEEVPTDVRVVSIAMGTGRILIGLGLAATPEIAMRMLGFPRYGPETLVVSRVAGARDIVMGAATLLALGDRRRLAAAHLANAAADAGDAATFGTALAASDKLRGAGVRGLAAAVPAAIVGLWAAARLRTPG
jgi:hypothetical protein